MKKKQIKRDYVARLTIYGLEKEVNPLTVAKWLEKCADNVRYMSHKIDTKLYTMRLMK
jgi:hypothetical protein